MKQLIGAEAQDVDDLRIQPIERSPREMDDEVIERGAPALDARRNFCCKRAIAIVGESVAGGGDCRWQIATGRDRRLDVVRGNTGRADHRGAGADVNRSPGATA
jgi:hypothetical protein